MKHLGLSLLVLSSVIACSEKKDDESSDSGPVTSAIFRVLK
jgi:hypothetical protein